MYQPRKKRLILSLDGGGVRGGISCSLLECIEREILKEVSPSGEVHSRKFCDILSAVGGTSAGAITAGLVATKNSFYDISNTDFSSKQLEKTFIKTWLARMPLVGKLFQQYRGEEKHKKLQEMLGSVKINELGMKILIPTYNWTRQSPSMFHNFSNALFTPLADARLCDAVHASSSPPYYFPCVSVPFSFSEPFSSSETGAQNRSIRTGPGRTGPARTGLRNALDDGAFGGLYDQQPQQKMYSHFPLVHRFTGSAIINRGIYPPAHENLNFPDTPITAPVKFYQFNVENPSFLKRQRSSRNGGTSNRTARWTVVSKNQDFEKDKRDVVKSSEPQHYIFSWNNETNRKRIENVPRFIMEEELDDGADDYQKRTQRKRGIDKKTRKSREGGKRGEVRSSANGTYRKISETRSGDYHCDGGLATNTPDITLYGMAKTEWPEDDIFLLSIGTGTDFNDELAHKPYSSNILGILTPAMFNSMNNAPDDVNPIDCQLLVENSATRYLRINPVLPFDFDTSIVNCSPEHVQKIQELGREWFQDNRASLQTFFANFLF